MNSSEYRYEMDDALKRGNLSPAFDIFNRYHVESDYPIRKGAWPHLTKVSSVSTLRYPEDLLIDRQRAIPWAQTEKQLDELWRKRRVKDAVLNLKLTDKEPEKIQELLHKRFSNRLTRSRQTNNEDVYQLYMNSFTKTYDPHTQLLFTENLGKFQHQYEPVARRYRRSTAAGRRIHQGRLIGYRRPC